MSGKKRSHSRRRGETSATEDSSEDSESSTDDDRKAKKAKAKDSASRSRHFDGSRSGTTHDGSHRSTHKEKRKSKHTKKVSKDRKSKRKKSKGAPERLEGRDVPLHQAKELKANKQSCMAFISSTRIAPTAVSHSSSGEKRRPSLDGAVEKTQQSSSGNDTSETPRLVVGDVAEARCCIANMTQGWIDGALMEQEGYKGVSMFPP